MPSDLLSRVRSVYTVLSSAPAPDGLRCVIALVRRPKGPAALADKLAKAGVLCVRDGWDGDYYVVVKDKSTEE